MNLNSLITERYDDFINLCKQHRVSKIYAFGSSITDQFDPVKSDIDVIVDLDIKDPIQFGETLLSFWDNLETFFGRKVDLLTEDSITNPYLRKSIESTKKLIYDGQREKVFVWRINSVDHILSFTNDLKSFDQYKKNFLVKGAVERHLAIIGEAINKFSKVSKQNELINSKQIISLRNRLIHSYDNIDDRIIWTIVKRHLIPLKDEIMSKIGWLYQFGYGALC